ncbi:unnamed protein product [Aphis gossypii]|uniref:Uncharacterized protein n=1 Tax=Aphis gossypii TaxID=80765 RepID=A0A9P0IQ89_APHGO|nr:unnamed protein product [Aphis gossypii]
MSCRKGYRYIPIRILYSVSEYRIVSVSLFIPLRRPRIIIIYVSVPGTIVSLPPAVCIQTKWTAAAVTVKYGTRWHRLNTRRVSCSHLSRCAVLRAQNTQYTCYSLRHGYDVNYYSDLNPFNNIFITRTIAVPIEHL